MIRESIFLMSVFDLAVIGVVIFAFGHFYSQIDIVKKSGTYFGFYLILIGLFAIGLFYLVDLSIMIALPAVFPELDLMSLMTDLRLNFSSFVVLAGTRPGRHPGDRGARTLPRTEGAQAHRGDVEFDREASGEDTRDRAGGHHLDRSRPSHSGVQRGRRKGFRVPGGRCHWRATRRIPSRTGESGAWRSHRGILAITGGKSADGSSRPNSGSATERRGVPRRGVDFEARVGW